jgi:hypothetical protein
MITNSQPLLFIPLFSEEQMQYAKCVSQNLSPTVWHIDATGSTVRPMDERPIYYYAVVMAMKEKGMAAVPLYEFLTNVHNVGNLKMALMAWWGHMSSLDIQPDVIVLDFSWALIHAVLFIICHDKIHNYLSDQWHRLLDATSGFNNGPCIRLCCCHYIKSVARRLAKLPVPNT